MCKFDSLNAPGFRAVSTDLRAWSLEAPSVISIRWAVEDEERAARVRNDINERMSPYLSPVHAGSVSPQRPLTPVVSLSPPSQVATQPRVFLETPRGDVAGMTDRAFSALGRQQRMRDNAMWSRWGAGVYEIKGST